MPSVGTPGKPEYKEFPYTNDGYLEALAYSEEVGLPVNEDEDEINRRIAEGEGGGGKPVRRGGRNRVRPNAGGGGAAGQMPPEIARLQRRKKRRPPPAEAY